MSTPPPPTRTWNPGAAQTRVDPDAAGFPEIEQRPTSARSTALTQEVLALTELDPFPSFLDPARAETEVLSRGAPTADATSKPRKLGANASRQSFDPSPLRLAEAGATKARRSELFQALDITFAPWQIGLLIVFMMICVVMGAFLAWLSQR